MITVLTVYNDSVPAWFPDARRLPVGVLPDPDLIKAIEKEKYIFVIGLCRRYCNSSSLSSYLVLSAKKVYLTLIENDGKETLCFGVWDDPFPTIQRDSMCREKESRFVPIMSVVTRNDLGEISGNVHPDTNLICMVGEDSFKIIDKRELALRGTCKEFHARANYTDTGIAFALAHLNANAPKKTEEINA